jgi:hypothetical protein
MKELAIFLNAFAAGLNLVIWSRYRSKLNLILAILCFAVFILLIVIWLG